MTRSEIIHLSYGCGTENAGNILSWLVAREKLKDTFQKDNPSTCIERNGKLGESPFLKNVLPRRDGTKPSPGEKRRFLSHS